MSGRFSVPTVNGFSSFFLRSPRRGKVRGRGVFSLIVCAAVSFSAFWFPSGTAVADEDIEIWVHPYLSATQIVKRFSPLAAFLEEKTGRPFIVRVSRNYDEHIERVGLDEADVAYLGPMSYVQATGRYGPKPILASLLVEGKPYFYGVVFVSSDSDIRELKDLEGRSFAFADKNSTMGYFLPRYLLESAGVTVDKLSLYRHLKSHEDVALAVIGGYFDAGGVKEEVFRRYRERGLRALATSPKMPEHLFITSSDMDPEMVSTIRRLLLDIGSSEQTADIVTSIKDTATGFGEIKDEDYDVYRDIFRRIGFPDRMP